MAVGPFMEQLLWLFRGNHWVLLVAGEASMMVVMLLLCIWPSRVMAMVTISYAAVPYQILSTTPYDIVRKTSKPEELGYQLGLMNASMPVAQVLVSMSSGPLVATFGGDAKPLLFI